jgi:hypothetical protein
MARLINAEVGAAGEGDAGDQSPACVVDGIGGDAFSVQRGDGRVHVVAHQVEPGGLGIGGFDIVEADFGGGQGEEQAAVAGVDEFQLQRVAKEGAIGFDVVAEHHDVGAGQHFGHAVCCRLSLGRMEWARKGCAIGGRGFGADDQRWRPTIFLYRVAYDSRIVSRVALAADSTVVGC